MASPILNRNTSCFIFTWFETIASIYCLLVYSKNRPNINILSSFFFFYSTTSTDFAHWRCIYTVQRQFSKMCTISICKQCLNRHIMLFFFFIHCSPKRTKTTLKNHLLVASGGQRFLCCFTVSWKNRTKRSKKPKKNKKKYSVICSCPPNREEQKSGKLADYRHHRSGRWQWGHDISSGVWVRASSFFSKSQQSDAGKYCFKWKSVPGDELLWVQPRLSARR